MNFILQSIVGFFLDLITSALDVISEEFYTVLQLNGKNTLDLFFSLFMPNAVNGTGDDSIWTLSVALGLLVLYFNLVLGLFKAFFGPLAKAESPLKLVAKFLFFCVFVSNARTICNFFFDIGTAPYGLLGTMDFDGTANMGTALTEISEKMTNEFSVAGAFADIIKAAFTLFVLCAILINYVKLIIEVAERYVILGILSLVAPMCIATGSSESTANIAKAWVRMMVSQVIVMCMSVLFLRVFEGAVGRVGSIDSWAANPKPGIFLVLVLILAWLRTGQRIDSHMGTLGLTVAQAGNGLYGDMMAGAALAKSAKNAVGKGLTMGTGIAAAHGGRAWAASKEGEKILGTGVSRVARAAQSIGGAKNPHGAQSKINTAKFDAKTSGIGVNRGQSAVNGIKAKYGDAKSANNPDGKSLNDLLKEGGTIKSAAMAADGSGEATVVDKNGNELSMAFTTDKDGNPTVGLQGNDQALSNAANAEKAGEMNSDDVMNAVGGEEVATNNLDAGGDCVLDENDNVVEGGINPEDASGIQTAEDGQDVTGIAGNDGMVNAGTSIQDKDGNEIGIADGEGNMMTDGQYAMDADGNLQDVTGIAGINSDGQAIDADGNVMKDADGNAIQMADVGGAGSVGVDKDGNFVDANGNVVGDSAATSDIAMAADGSVFAKGEDGQYHAVQDDKGNALSVGENQALNVGADGNITGVSAQNESAITGINSDGQAINADGNIVPDADGNAQQMADIGGAGSVGVDGDGNFIDADGNVVGDSAATSDIAMAADGSVFTKGEDGQYHAAQDSQGNALSVGENQALNIGADGKVTGVSAQGQAAGIGSTLQGGTAMAGGALSVAQSVNSGVGNMARNSAGEMVGISNAIGANGKIDASQVKTDANGSFIKANDGSRVGVSGDSASGYSVTGGTFAAANGHVATNTPNANGTSQTAAVVGGAIAGGVVASLGRNTATYNRDSQGTYSGGYAMTSGGMVALGNSIDSKGHVTNAGSVRPDSSSSTGYSMSVNGSQVPVKADSSSPSNFSIAGATYSKASDNTGQFAVGSNSSGNAMLVKTNGNGSINRYSQTQSGQLSLSGNSAAISHSYGAASNGGGSYVKDGNNNYQQIYSGAGGKTDGGSPQLYKRGDDGSYTPISSSSQLGAKESAFVRTSANNSQGYNYSNVGTKENLPKDGSCRTYNQTGSYYNGIGVSRNSDGSYGIQLSRGANAESYGNGKISLNTGNGGSVLLKDTAMYKAPSENAMVAKFNGRNYYVEPTSSAAVGNVGGQNQRQIRSNAQSLVNSCNDGTVRNYFQGQVNKGAGKGYRSYAAAERVVSHKNGSFTIISSIPASKDKSGKTTATKAMTFYPCSQFKSNNPDAIPVTVKGQACYAVPTRCDQRTSSIQATKGAGISKRTDLINPKQMGGSMELNREFSFVDKNSAAARTARQRRRDEIDKMEGRR